MLLGSNFNFYYNFDFNWSQKQDNQSKTLTCFQLLLVGLEKVFSFWWCQKTIKVVGCQLVIDFWILLKPGPLRDDFIFHPYYIVAILLVSLTPKDTEFFATLIYFQFTVYLDEH